MGDPQAEAVRRWSAAIREIEVIEPWLTESGWDEHYWDDVAERVVDLVGLHPRRRQARKALKSALAEAFPDVALKSNNGLYLDGLDRRIDLIVGLAGGGDSSNVRRSVIDRVAPEDWSAARDGFGDPDLAAE